MGRIRFKINHKRGYKSILELVFKKEHLFQTENAQIFIHIVSCSLKIVYFNFRIDCMYTIYKYYKSLVFISKKDNLSKIRFWFIYQRN